VSVLWLRDLGLDAGQTQEDADALKLKLLHEPKEAWNKPVPKPPGVSVELPPLIIGARKE
jgi:hypothetical protein